MFLFLLLFSCSNFNHSSFINSSSGLSPILIHDITIDKEFDLIFNVHFNPVFNQNPNPILNTSKEIFLSFNEENCTLGFDNEMTIDIVDISPPQNYSYKIRTLSNEDCSDILIKDQNISIQLPEGLFSIDSYLSPSKIVVITVEEDIDH